MYYFNTKELHKMSQSTPRANIFGFNGASINLDDRNSYCETNLPLATVRRM